MGLSPPYAVDSDNDQKEIRNKKIATTINGPDFRKMNKRSIGEKEQTFVPLKDGREFLNERTKKSKEQNSFSSKLPVFGKPTVVGESIATIIEQQQQHASSHKGLTKTGLPQKYKLRDRPTKASLGHRRVERVEYVSNFKLSKFLKVPSKIRIT